MKYWHLLAVVTIALWGTSFVSTKTLLVHDFTAVQIFTLRFVVTYLILLAANHKEFFCKSLKHEFKLFICGITGCTIYFWAENTALSFSPSSNVSLIVCVNPLLIMIFGSLLYKSERISFRQIVGCLITFLGMVLVVLNGKFILNLSPKGDALAFASALVWTIYSLVIRQLNSEYSSIFITRKVFFYGAITSIPLFILEDSSVPFYNFTEPVVALNFLSLTVFSSLFGYLVWNFILKKLGTVLASNYIYCIPLVTMVTAVIALNERITLVAILGAVCILAGLLLAEFKK